MNFGGCSLPAATPRNAPIPSSSHSARSSTFTLEPGRLGDALRHLGQVRGMHLVGRRVDEIAREPRGPREDLAGADALGDLARGAGVGRDDAAPRRRTSPVVSRL